MCQNIAKLFGMLFYIIPFYRKVPKSRMEGTDVHVDWSIQGLGRVSYWWDPGIQDPVNSILLADPVEPGVTYKHGHS